MLLHVLGRGSSARDAATKLQAASEIARGATDLQIDLEVVEGDVSAQIVERARANRAQLIVMGHGRRRIADHVLQRGDIPVLVVNNPRTDAPYRRARIATDNETTAKRFGEHVLGLLGDRIERIHVVHAVHAPSAHAHARRKRLEDELVEEVVHAFDHADVPVVPVVDQSRVSGRTIVGWLATMTRD